MKKLYLLFICLIFTNTLMKAQDWANLSRYQEENHLLLEESDSQQRVVFMGNSITEGWKNAHPEFFSSHYINRGISGQTTPQMLVRFRQDVINLKPKVVVILAGINDIAENTGPSTIEMICDNLASMAELAHANDIKVILCSVLPAYEFPWAKGKEPADKIVQLNQWIKGYAIKNGFTYVDYYSSMVNEQKGLKAEYSEDGIHPNSSGYDVMLPIIERAIKEISE